MNEGSILVVCPAVLRYSWAEELERWLPFCLPSDIHLGKSLYFIAYPLLNFCILRLLTMLVDLATLLISTLVWFSFMFYFVLLLLRHIS